MPSVISVLLREQLRLLKPLLSKMSISGDRAAQDKIGDMGARVLSAKLESVPVPFDTFEAEMITPKEHSKTGVILYLHGGGYTAGSLKYAHGFGSVLANRMNLRVLCAAYRLAPEHPFPAALEDAYAAYRYLLQEGFSPDEIFLAGESAGGGLIFCLIHYLKARGEALPAKLVGISPWTDLRLVGASCLENEKTDPVLTKDRLAYYASLYAGTKIAEPFVSPVCGEFSGFPPALVFVGGDEILLDDSILLKDKYDEAGAQCELVIEEGLWHVYVLFAVPEAQRALDKINDFLKVEVNGKADETLDET